MKLVVWPATIVGGNRRDDFEKFLGDNGFSANLVAEYKTLPGLGGDGGRNDVLFSIHDKDVPKFSVWRLQYGMRWWDDYLDTDRSIVPPSVLEMYGDSVQ